MKIEDPDFPHSIAIWLRWELHQRNPNGKLEGSPKEHKEYKGVIHFDSKNKALYNIDYIISKLKEELENATRK